MRLVPYSEILAHVSDLMGWETGTTGQANLDTAQWHTAKRCISRALGVVWRDSFWPSLTRTELRRFQPEYDATEAVTAGLFRFFPPTGEYYQALRAFTGQAPATEVTPGQWETNLSYWADASRSLTADNYDATVTYVQGDVVYSPATDTYHQVHTAGVAGTAVTNTAVWGTVSELDPVVPWTADGLLPMESIAGVWDENPKTSRWPTPVPWEESTNGLQIRDETLNEVWITYRLRCPRFVGDIWDSSATYTAVSDEGTGPATVVTVGGRYFGIAGRTALRALTTHADMEVVDLLFLVTDGDANGGKFRFKASETTADDGVDYIRPNDIDAASPGRWVRDQNLT